MTPSVWHDAWEILSRADSLALAALVVGAIGVVLSLDGLWPRRRSTVVRIDPELARRDREARTHEHVNRIRSLSAPAPKGFGKRVLPFNPNHSQRIH